MAVLKVAVNLDCTAFLASNSGQSKSPKALIPEALRLATEKLDCKNFYAFNPDFDRKQANATAMKNRNKNR